MKDENRATHESTEHRGIDKERRALIGAAAGVGAAMVAPGVVLHAVQAQADPRSEPVTSDVRWGLVIDTAKCADGCSACVDACNEENGLDLQTKPGRESEEKWDRQKAVWIRKVKLQDNQTGRITNLPMMCQHCEDPPCVDVCPTGASFKRADGIVMVDRHLCIGCRYCMMACPYKARSFIHEDLEGQLTSVPRGKGCVESCNLCAHRRDYGEDSTACADACAAEGHNAIVFGDLKDPNSIISQLLKELSTRQIREDLELNTGVRYAGV
ncbi:sulfate reduction electron transfer complex DsrMKJOP subunit DsrO [Imhoffiella purpurea]|uniref:Sulfite reduction-associated complex DsrMKJOP iron-sulfur protein DsrO n=1 Tax=Imhoffiella purpurea TaxID=1249627 RepID=W9V5Y7_9GAMM|nr:4Fe-4S dicluster domain-containing protein [Imhoffiella purpurea]EXJ14784.1 Sulfite reduction-associated complex DsrMKJOP iron-sulfur protein DsrO [Imhoffiella purpurea]